ncbi:MAG: ATP-dependent sacrificial sulfur transferase LarE [Candidatus Micrarchaeia archaeon]
MFHKASSKLRKLVSAVKEKAPLVVALSGGVDSSVVAKAAFLASNKSIAVTVINPTVSKREIADARKIARAIGMKHRLIRRKLSEEVGRNDALRCYYCKKEIIKILKRVAKEEGIETVADGSNKDDLRDFRVGLKACKEEGVYSPLLALGFGKKDVRKLAREMGLPNYEKPSEACLSSRVMNQRINEKVLRKIGKAEHFVRKLTGASIVRVRDYGDTARIEVDKEHIDRLIKASGRVNKKLNKLGYKYVTVDLGGYRVGG